MTRKRKILHITGTRAEFGLLSSTLRLIDTSKRLKLGLVVTGMHLSEKLGLTVREIEASGLPIVARIPTDVDQRTTLAMSKSVGQTIVGISEVIEREQPDLLTVIGDRGEMLAGAIAALNMGVPTVHLHGGERSGTIDESIRHAITKLSHWHFVATEESRQRVIRLGEPPDCVLVTGAPSLDDIGELRKITRREIATVLGISETQRFAVVLFHPVLQEIGNIEEYANALYLALQSELAAHDIVTIWLAPNADAGSAAIAEQASRAVSSDARLVKVVDHLQRREFIAALNHAEVLVGNSSAGIIEAASLGIPVVNIGSRQQCRERNENTHDCGYGAQEIRRAISLAVQHGRYPNVNRYGSGNAGKRIVDLLESLPDDRKVLNKLLTY